MTGAAPAFDSSSQHTLVTCVQHGMVWSNASGYTCWRRNKAHALEKVEALSSRHRHATFTSSELRLDADAGDHPNPVLSGTYHTSLLLPPHGTPAACTHIHHCCWMDLVCMVAAAMCNCGGLPHTALLSTSKATEQRVALPPRQRVGPISCSHTHYHAHA